MKALLLAAGYGTRLRPLTDDRPKPMVEVAGRPLVDYLLCWLAEHGVREVAINLHHAPTPLRAYVGDGRRFAVQVRYSYEEKLLGSAGALIPLRPFLAGSESFVVVYGDVLTNLDLGRLLDRHHATGADATIAVTTAEDPTRCGVVGFDREGWISRLVEKPPHDEVFSEFVNTGVYACSPRVLDALPEPCPVPYDFASDLFPRMLSTGHRLQAAPVDGLVIDIGSMDRLQAGVDAVERGLVSSSVAGVSPC